LQAIQDYCTLAPEGVALLKAEVTRLFPCDDIEEMKLSGTGHTDTIEEIIQEILQRHADGIHFREWNAGQQIDSNMKDLGFNIDVSLETSTGFIYGGTSVTAVHTYRL
jgi:glycogen debranching enzyme